jgi:hypothetical protein
MELLGTSFSAVQKSLIQDGGLTAIQNTSLALQKMGPGAALIATNFGLSATQVGQFQTNASKLPAVSADAKAIATNTQSIGDAYTQSNTALRALDLLWNTFKADAINAGTIFTPLVTSFANAITDMMGDAGQFFNDLTNGIANVIVDVSSGKLTSAFSDVFKTVGSAFQDLVITPAAQVGAALANATGTTTAGALNSNLQATGVGFSSAALQKIDTQASNSGLTASLISALQTGIKSGQYTTLNSTFNLNVPQGSQGLTSKQIAQQLYNMFQGTQ